MSCSSDRWSCEQCPPGAGTFVAVGSQADTAAAIQAVQHRHAAAHRHAADVLAHLGLDQPQRKQAS